MLPFPAALLHFKPHPRALVLITRSPPHPKISLETMIPRRRRRLLVSLLLPYPSPILSPTHIYAQTAPFARSFTLDLSYRRIFRQIASSSPPSAIASLKARYACGGGKRREIGWTQFGLLLTRGRGRVLSFSLIVVFCVRFRRRGNVGILVADGVNHAGKTIGFNGLRVCCEAIFWQ